MKKTLGSLICIVLAFLFSVSACPAGTEELSEDERPFTIVWMTDTQNFCHGENEVLASVRDWILASREEKNIVFVAHTGDVVDGFGDEKWNCANWFLLPVFDEIPGAIASGNHDISNDLKYQYFLRQDYAQKNILPEQSYMDGLAYYQVIETGATELLVFAYGYKVTGEVWDWTLDVMNEYPDATAVFLMHHGMELNGSLSGQAKQLEKNVVSKNPNARLLLSGHLRGTAFTEKDYVSERGEEYSFYAMMFNYQDDIKHGAGFLRTLTFDPVTRSVTVDTYSPYLDEHGYGKTPAEKDHFVLEYAF